MTNSRRLVFPALVAAGVLWGTTVPLSKLALGWMGPAWLAFARFALAACLLMLVSRARLRSACSPAILISGAAGYGGSVLLQNLGIERTSVTHAALLIGATPVLVAITAAVLGHSVARPLAWAGFAISLVGVGFVAGGQGTGSTLAGDGLVLAAQLVSAGFTVSQARLLRGRDPVAVTGLQLMAAAAAMLPIALTTESRPVSAPPGAASLAVIGLVLAGTVLPTTLFAFGQSRVSADVAGAFLNLEPLVGAVAGTVLFADPLGPIQLAGCAAITTGIALSSFQVVRGERVLRSAGAAEAAVSRRRQAPGGSPLGRAGQPAGRDRLTQHGTALRRGAASALRGSRQAGSRPARQARPGRTRPKLAGLRRITSRRGRKIVRRSAAEL